MRDEYFASGRYGRLRMGMGLRGPAFTSAARNAEDYAFARDLGLPISIHVGMAGTGHAVADLERDGLLGPDVNYVHGNFLTDAEWDLLAASGGTVTITPSTDMLMQFGTYPATGAALSRGIVSGFGIDTICSAGTDLFSEMRLALAAERSRANATAISADKMAPTVDLHQRDMLRLATIDGARVWHLEDEIGTLTPGKQADIAIIDLRSPHLDGFGDPVAVMVLGAGPADVETVIVGGDIVKRDGKLAGDHVGHARELMHAARGTCDEPGIHHRLGRRPRPHGGGDPGPPGTRGHPARPQRPARRRRRRALPSAERRHRGPDHDRGMRQVAAANAAGPSTRSSTTPGSATASRAGSKDGLEHVFASTCSRRTCSPPSSTRPRGWSTSARACTAAVRPVGPAWTGGTGTAPRPTPTASSSTWSSPSPSPAGGRTLSNALEPGWVATNGRRGRARRPVARPGHPGLARRQRRPAATVTAGYFYHQRLRQVHPPPATPPSRTSCSTTAHPDRDRTAGRDRPVKR